MFSQEIFSSFENIGFRYIAVQHYGSVHVKIEHSALLAEDEGIESFSHMTSRDLDKNKQVERDLSDETNPSLVMINSRYSE